MKSHSKYQMTIPIIAMVALLSGCGLDATQPDARNKIAIIIDCSGSYGARLQVAVQRSVALTEMISQRTLKRWEQSHDSVAIITLDALPAVIWQGSLRDLQETDSNVWVDRLTARREYRWCTDVQEAFDLAANFLSFGDPRYVGKYVIAFTDLIHEPPTTNIRRCQPPGRPSLPPENFPWEALRDASVSVFWMPPNQLFAWHRAIADMGMSEVFHLYDEEESDRKDIEPPAPAEAPISEVDREALHADIVVGVRAVLKWIGIGVGTMVAFAFTIAFISRLRRPRRQTRPPRPANVLNRR